MRFSWGVWFGWVLQVVLVSLGLITPVLFAVAAVFGIVNAFLKPILKILGLPFILLTLGLFALVINAALFLLTARLTQALTIDGFGAAFWGSLVVSLVSFLLGLFLDGISIIVMSLPITLPLATMAGFDPVWFGVYLVIMVELAQVTPPVGFNLFVIQGLTGHPIGRVALAAMPFFFLMCLAVLILTIFPGIALWLPNVLFG